MNDKTIGYVVLVWNQASGQPDALEGSFTEDLQEAGQIAADERSAAAEIGRRERYAVAEIVPVEEAR